MMDATVSLHVPDPTPPEIVMGDFTAAVLNGSHVLENATEAFSCHMNGYLDRTAVTNETAWRLSEELVEARFAIVAIELLLCLIAFLWNLFIILAMLSKRHMLKEPSNIYLLSLSVSHFMLTVAILPITLNTLLTNEYNYGSSDYARCCICNFSGIMLMVLTSVALHTLAALSVDRFIILLNPLKYRKFVSWWKALLVVVLIWFVSFWIGIPPVVGFGKYQFNTILANCHPVWTGSDFNYVRFVMFESLIPITLLLVTNVWTVKIVWDFMKKRMQRRTTIRKHEGRLSIHEEGLHHRRKQWMLVRTYTFLFVVYIISYTPIFIVAIISNFISLQPLSWPLELVVFGWLCYFINPVLHPLIEAFFIKDIREILKNGCCARLKRFVVCSTSCTCCSCQLKQPPMNFHQAQATENAEQDSPCVTPSIDHNNLDDRCNSITSILRTEEPSERWREIDLVVSQGRTYRLYESTNSVERALC